MSVMTASADASLVGREMTALREAAIRTVQATESVQTGSASAICSGAESSAIRRHA